MAGQCLQVVGAVSKTYLIYGLNPYFAHWNCVNKSKWSLLCFAQFMEREIARKNRNKIGWKMTMPLITQIKRNDKVNKTKTIAVGLDK